MNTYSKFFTLACLSLALIFGTRWCILTFYSGTYVPTDARSLHGQMQLAAPSTRLFQEEDAPAAKPTPPFQTFHASAGR